MLNDHGGSETIRRAGSLAGRPSVHEDRIRSLEPGCVAAGLRVARSDAPGGRLGHGQYPAEGYERRGDREFARYLSIAKSSAGELESHLWVALDLGYLEADEFAMIRDQVARAKRRIVSLMRYLNTPR